MAPAITAEKPTQACTSAAGLRPRARHRDQTSIVLRRVECLEWPIVFGSGPRVVSATEDRGACLEQYLDGNLRIKRFTGTDSRRAVGIADRIADLAEGAGTEGASGLRIVIAIE
jgi:hypothetical protein